MKPEALWFFFFVLDNIKQIKYLHLLAVTAIEDSLNYFY